MTVGSCPKCGADVRSRKMPAAALILGLLLVGITITNPSDFWLFGIFGAFIGIGGGYTLYDRRNRIKNAKPEMD